MSSCDNQKWIKPFPDYKSDYEMFMYVCLYVDLNVIRHVISFLHGTRQRWMKPFPDYYSEYNPQLSASSMWYTLSSASLRHIHIHIYTYTYIYTSHTYKYICICAYIDIYIIHIHIHIYIYIYIYIYITYMYFYVYVYWYECATPYHQLSPCNTPCIYKSEDMYIHRYI